MKKLIALLLLPLAACKHDISTVHSVSTVYVDRPAACPNRQESDRLIASRPVPLRNRTMPKTRLERVAQSEAQLGKYEADGGWSDQVVVALKRCQVQ